MQLGRRRGVGPGAAGAPQAGWQPQALLNIVDALLHLIKNLPRCNACLSREGTRQQTITEGGRRAGSAEVQLGRSNAVLLLQAWV